MNATLQPLPSDFDLPLEALMAWNASHRNALRVQRDAQTLIAQLDFVASLECRVGLVRDRTPMMSVEENDEHLDSMLASVRRLHAELQGSTVRRVQRDVDRFTPHLRERLADSIAAARAQVEQMRAIAAFLIGEHDDVELGIELVPEAGEPMEPEDSTPAH